MSNTTTHDSGMAASAPNGTVRPGMIVPATIEGIAPDGRGVASASGRQLLVRGALPGDEVDARVFRRRGGRLEATCVSVRREGYPRREPRCAHTGQCGGCTWQQWEPGIQHEMKRRMVREALTRAMPDAAIEVLPVIAAGPEFGYRNKMEFTFGKDETGAVTLGLHRVGRFDATFDVKHCWIAPEAMNAVRAWVCEWARRHALVPYDPRRFVGALRHLVLREAAATGEVMANLVCATGEVAGLDELSEGLPAELPQVKSLLFSVNTRRGDTAHAETTVVLSGRPAISERIGAMEVTVSPISFLQTNSAGAERLYSVVSDVAALSGEERVLDMYCGIGLIGISLAPRAREVVGLEQVPSAVRDANAMRERLGYTHVQFRQGDAEAVLPAWADRGERFDVVIVDPPRAGLHPKALAALVRMSPRVIVYVSCNPVTLAADSAQLCSVGYRIGAAHPVDLFPHTPHIETVVRLEK